jgi:hypothetical protein
MPKRWKLFEGHIKTMGWNNHNLKCIMLYVFGFRKKEKQAKQIGRARL